MGLHALKELRERQEPAAAALKLGVVDKKDADEWEVLQLAHPVFGDRLWNRTFARIMPQVSFNDIKHLRR